MGAPLLAYVQNIVQDLRVRVSSRLVMCGSTTSVRGQVLRNCSHGTADAGLLARGLHRGVLHLGGRGLHVLDR